MESTTPPTRRPLGREAQYLDPLDVIWTATATRLGLRLARSREVFAAWDGQGTLTLADAADFDPDDSLAQLVLHELCHALVEGPEALARADWGLCNHTDRDLVREHACHRLQAALLEPYGLRRVLAPTTEHRPYYEALPADPLAGDPLAGDAQAGAALAGDPAPNDPALAPAQAGFERATRGPWAAALAEALAATARVAAAAAPFAGPDSIYRRFTGAVGVTGSAG